MIAVLHEHRDIAVEALGRIKAEFESAPAGPDDRTIFDHIVKNAPQPRVVAQSGDLAEGERLLRRHGRADLSEQLRGALSHGDAFRHGAVRGRQSHGVGQFAGAVPGEERGGGGTRHAAPTMCG